MTLNEIDRLKAAVMRILEADPARINIWEANEQEARAYLADRDDVTRRLQEVVS